MPTADRTRPPAERRTPSVAARRTRVEHGLVVGADDLVACDRGGGVALGGDHDGDGGAVVPDQRRVLVEATGRRGHEQGGQRAAQAGEHDLGLGVAEAGVELDDAGAVLRQGEAGVEEPGEVDAPVPHLVDGGLQDPLEHVVDEVGRRPGQR